MPEINFLSILVAALVPNILGAIYYGPLFGKKWLASMGKTEEEMKHKNEILIYIGSFVLAFIVAFFLNFFIAMGHKELNDAGELVFASFETFKHGAFHGMMMCLGIVVPVLVSLGLFHKAKASNILLNVAFWVVCFSIMGGILDVWK